MRNCRFWSADDPYLYTLRIEALRGGKVVDEYGLPVGVRTVEVKGDRFLLNGKPVYFKGACRHEDFPVLGRAMNEAVLVRDFSVIKWMNANSYRTVHYPHSEEELNLADEQGVLIIDETAAVGMNDWIHPVFTDEIVNAKTRETHMRLLERQYQRDKNHPSRGDVVAGQRAGLQRGRLRRLHRAALPTHPRARPHAARHVRRSPRRRSSRRRAISWT